MWVLSNDESHRNVKAMRLYYINESEGPRYYVRSALGVDAERWNDLFRDIREWRIELRRHYGIPTGRELRPCELLAKGMLVPDGEICRLLTPVQGAEIFRGGLRLIEEAARGMGGVEVINVCLRKTNCERYVQVSLDRLLNRINASVKSSGRYAFLIFDDGNEDMITSTYRRLRKFNPVPSRYELWEEGERIRNIPVENVIGGPVFRSSGCDYLLQVAGLVAHALLVQEETSVPVVESPGIHEVFSILDKALNRKASGSDRQGIVRG